jgi:hypothetical protein
LAKIRIIGVRWPISFWLELLNIGRYSIGWFLLLWPK